MRLRERNWRWQETVGSIPQSATSPTSWERQSQGFTSRRVIGRATLNRRTAPNRYYPLIRRPRRRPNSVDVPLQSLWRVEKAVPKPRKEDKFGPAILVSEFPIRCMYIPDRIIFRGREDSSGKTSCLLRHVHRFGLIWLSFILIGQFLASSCSGYRRLRPSRSLQIAPWASGTNQMYPTTRPTGKPVSPNVIFRSFPSPATESSG